VSAANAAAQPGAAPDRRFLADVAVSFRREIAPVLRNWYYVLFGLLQPLLYLGLFVPLLGEGAGHGGGVGSPLQWFVPGMIVMLTLFSTATCGWTLTEELMSGSFERFLATPMSRPALLVGRALKELVPLLVQALAIVLVAAPFGLEVHAAAMALGLALLLAFGIGIAAMSYALAIATKRDGSVFYLVTHSISLPLMLLGGVLLPMDAAPRWLYLASRANPLTYLVEAERALFAGTVAHASVAWGALVAAGVAVLGLRLGAAAIRRAGV
jgi:ABC-2 type transport system permease protein